MSLVRIIPFIAMLSVAIAPHSLADFITVRIVEDDSLNAEARAALASDGFEHADTARVFRIYAVYEDEGPQSDIDVYSATITVFTRSPFHSFFNHPLGTELPPNEELLAANPSLAFDTFVTLNQTSQGRTPLLRFIDYVSGAVVSNDTIKGGADVTVEGFLQNVGAPATPLQEGEIGTLMVQITLLGAQCVPDAPWTVFGVMPNYYNWPVATWDWSVAGNSSGQFDFTGSYPCYASVGLDEDITARFFVNGDDLAQLLAAWGPHDSCEKADLNSDGVVDVVDLSVLLSEWGNCYCCEHINAE